MKTLHCATCVLAACIAWQGILHAEPATRPAPAGRLPIPKVETPLGALQRGTKVFDQLNVDAAMELFDFANPDEEKLVRLNCEYAIALTRLEHVVLAKSGRETADTLIHACGERTETDLLTADIHIDGAYAIVHFKGDADPAFPMVHANGVWKIASHEVAATMSDDEVKEYRKTLATSRDGLTTIQRDVESGKLRSIEDIIAAAQAVLFPAPKPGEQPKK